MEIHEGKELLFQERNAAKEPSETGWPWIVHCLKHLQLCEDFHRNYVDKSLNALILFCILGIWERGIITKINECLRGDLLLKRIRENEKMNYKNFGFCDDVFQTDQLKEWYIPIGMIL